MARRRSCAGRTSAPASNGARARPSPSPFAVPHFASCTRPTPTQVQLNAQLGEDPLKNKRLQLLNGYLAGLFEYLFPALCEVDLAAACAMAEICFNLLRRHPYIYGPPPPYPPPIALTRGYGDGGVGFWAMQWINSSEWCVAPRRRTPAPCRIRPASRRKSRAHQDKNDAKESLAALIYFHREGDSGARLHKLRFPDLGIALELRHGDVVFIKVPRPALRTRPAAEPVRRAAS